MYFAATIIKCPIKLKPDLFYYPVNKEIEQDDFQDFQDYLIFA